MVYTIFFKESAQRELGDLDKPIRKRIAKKIDSLAADPRPPGAEPLKGGEGEFKIRVGDHRIIYRVDDQSVTVLVIRIGHRGDVYRAR
jgi:mRNA interferase RelE/StbE